MEPVILPVSCCGKNPLGTTTNKKILNSKVAKNNNSIKRGCFNDQSKLVSYFFRTLCIKERCVFSGECFKKCAHIIGVTVSETSSETKMAIDRVIENSRNNLPTIPPINKIGMKTAISERLMETTVKP